MKFQMTWGRVYGDTRERIPVAHIDADFVVTRQGGVVMVLDVVGPNLEVRSVERQEHMLRRWVDALLTSKFSVSHVMATDIPTVNESAGYYLQRAGELRRTAPELATAALRRARHVESWLRFRYRSFMVCRYQLPTDVVSVADPRVARTAQDLRHHVLATVAVMSDEEWTVTVLNGPAIEAVLREAFDPYHTSTSDPMAAPPAWARPAAQQRLAMLPSRITPMLQTSVSRLVPTALVPLTAADGGSAVDRLAPDVIDVYPTHTVIERTYSRVYVIEEPPRFVGAATMHELYFWRDCPIRVAMQWRMDPHAISSIRARLTEAQATLLMEAERGIVSSFSARERAEAYAEALRQQELEDKPLIFLTMLVQVFGTSEADLQKNADDIENWFYAHDFHARLINDEQDLALESMLPLGEKHFTEKRNVQPPNIGSLYPHGVRTYDDPGGIVFGRDPFRRGLVRLNLFNATNTTVLVTGVPGAGKSTTVKDMLEQVAIAGHDVSIVDIEGEYVRLAEELGAQVIDMGRDKEVAVNFLDPAFDDFDDFLPALEILGQQAIVGALRSRTRELWQQVRARRRPPVLSDLIVLLEEDARTNELATALHTYIQPPYEAFFNQPTNIDLTGNIRCFVLRRDAGEGPSGRALLYLTQLFGMQYGLGVPGRSWSFIDEGWTHFAEQADAEKMLALCTRARKRAHMVVLVAPNASQLMRQSAGRTLLQNASVHIMLHQQSAALSDYRDAGLNEIDAQDISLIENSRIGEGLILMRAKGTQQLLRVPFAMDVPTERRAVYGGHAEPVREDDFVSSLPANVYELARYARRAA